MVAVRKKTDMLDMCSVAVGPATRGQLLCNVTGPIHRYATLRSTQQRRSWPRVADVHHLQVSFVQQGEHVNP